MFRVVTFYDMFSVWTSRCRYGGLFFVGLWDAPAACPQVFRYLLAVGILWDALSVGKKKGDTSHKPVSSAYVYTVLV